MAIDLSIRHTSMWSQYTLIDILGGCRIVTWLLQARGRLNERRATRKLHHGEPEGVLPLRSHVDERALHYSRHTAANAGSVEIHEAANAYPLEPVKVLLDARLRDIGVHPMPPHARLRLLRHAAKAVQ